MQRQHRFYVVAYDGLDPSPAGNDAGGTPLVTTARMPTPGAVSEHRRREALRRDPAADTLDLLAGDGSVIVRTQARRGHHRPRR